jgi:hypothetical protein
VLTPEENVRQVAERLGLAELSNLELLRGHAAILEELNKRGLLRTRNSPVSGYAEWLIATKLGLQLEPNSKAGFDATSEDGTRFEVKSRHLTPANNSLQSSAIRKLTDRHFEYLIGVVFEFDYSLRYTLKIPYDTVVRRAEFRRHTNSHILHLKRDLLEEPGVEDITRQVAFENAPGQEILV